MAGGAVGDGAHDDTAAIQAAIDAGVANNWPVHLSAGTYKVTSKLTIDYAGQASARLPADFRGRDDRRPRRRRGPVLRVQCSGGAPGARPDCFYFKQEGMLFVTRRHPGLCGGDRKGRFFGRAQHDQARPPERQQQKYRFRPPAAAGSITCSTAISGRPACRPAAAPGSRSNRHSSREFPGPAPRRAPADAGSCSKTASTIANTFLRARSRSVADLSQHHDAHDGQNTFVSPYFACTTAVDATASTHNLLINPTFRRQRRQSRAAIDRDRDHRSRQLGAVAVSDGSDLHRGADRRQDGAVLVQRARQRAGRQPAGARRGQGRLVDGLCQRQRQGIDGDAAVGLDPGGRQGRFPR